MKILAALLNFDSGAGFGKFLLDVLGFVFGNAFFDGLWGAFNKILGFFQTQTGDFADNLDDADLVAADGGENDIEFSLLFRWSCGAPPPAAGAAATATDAAAALTPKVSSSPLTSSEASSSDNPLIYSIML